MYERVVYLGLSDLMGDSWEKRRVVIVGVLNFLLSDRAHLGLFKIAGPKIKFFIRKSVQQHGLKISLRFRGTLVHSGTFGTLPIL